MRPDQKRSLTYFWFALPIITIWMVMVFGPSGDPFTSWLERWSTLIAGLMAVLAAVITVHQMRQSEDQQEERHRQLVRLTLRADRLIVLRAAHPQAKQLSEWSDRTSALLDRFEAERNDQDVNLPSADTLEQLAIVIFQCGAILTADGPSKAQDLLEPDMAIRYQQGLALTDKLAGRRGTIYALLGLAGEPDWRMQREPGIEALRAANTIVRPLIPLARHIANDLTELAAKYQ